MNTARSQFGFTLVEMIVSLAVFSIVVTVSVGALLVLVGTNQQLQGEQSVMTNLSFALDSMTREIRTGGAYYCESDSSNGSGSSIFNGASNLDGLLKSGQILRTQDCSNGNPSNLRFHGLAIAEGGDSITAGSERILYYFDSSEKKIFRRVGGGAAESIVSSGIVIEELDFFVTGTEPQSAAVGPATPNQIQPSVTIFIKATEKGAVTNKPYYLQTTITQRTLDV
jgi:prepilin-type N-terminal cleavage/methylation domain-containing protein